MVTTDLLATFPPSSALSVPPGCPGEPTTDLAPLIAGLRGRGLTCSILRIRVAGELDVRLRAGRPQTPVSVEVLGPAAGGRGWAAVRVHGDDRQVWLGPLPLNPALLADFVADLLECTEATLEQRYLRLG